jgi:hypothetical protein
MAQARCLVLKQGDEPMKLQRLTVVVTMVLLVMAMVAAPVQAGKPNGSITLQYTQDPWIYPPEFILTGNAVHIYFTLEGPITSNNPPLDGAVLSLICREVGPLMNPHLTVDGHSWGAAQAKWRLVKRGSGFEGTAHLGPWTDLSQNHNALILSGSGEGFGEFKNMHLWFSVDVTKLDATQWIWSVEIR